MLYQLQKNKKSSLKENHDFYAFNYDFIWWRICVFNSTQLNKYIFLTWLKCTYSHCILCFTPKYVTLCKWKGLQMLWHPFGGGRVFPNIRKSSFRWAKNNSRASKAMISGESLRDKHLLSLPITNDIQCACTIWQAALNPDATISYLRGWRMALGWKTLNLCCEAILSSSDALNNYVF